ncbi:MAG: SUMF1/EgtB/PvdO family nonheme iron enzyme [Candidatus Hydrogenedentes bacterium]|nr:SUMF1/EgtB/PvdO family nonheme iron enzyme [Candidatus Hydrogenedentota bacterium]
MRNWLPPRARVVLLWVLVAALAGCGRGEPQLPPTRVTFESAPEQGALVLVGGEDRGPTPVVVVGLPPGPTSVVLNKDGYRRKDEMVMVREGDQRVVIEMEPLVGFLSVDTDPQGAEVILDGENVLGTTPLVDKPVPMGKHTLDLRKQDHYPLHAELEVQVDFHYDPVYVLDPMESTLTVLSRPSSATIWLNNEPQTEKTPAKFTVRPGLYIVSTHTEGYVQADEKVDLQPNAAQTVTLKMKEGNVPAGMILVPAGTFLRGEDGRAPDESPRRELFVSAFYIDKYEVTNAEYKKVFPSHGFVVGQDQFPVLGVSWEQAMEYASKADKRLPTEIEWERAARGTDGREFPWGQIFDKSLCNTEESGVRLALRTGSYLAGMSPVGCLDMAGNAYEWTSSWYEAYPENTAIITSYGQVFRVLRGGSYMTPQFQARCAMRHFDRMDTKRADYGFRCAKDVGS